MTNADAPQLNSSTELRQAAVFNLKIIDPHGELIDHSQISDADAGEIAELMSAFAELRRAEQELSERVREYMNLGETDMRAIQFLIASSFQNISVTPGALTAHLGISSAATTKLLDRLLSAGHVTRMPHPEDRRAQIISVTPETQAIAMQKMGSHQAQRVIAAARLTSQERKIITDFITSMTAEIRGHESPQLPPG